jgi:ADP-heptose:LPS heptosyltransferase
MMETPRRVCGMLIARFHFRKAHDRVTRFTRALSEARVALLIMPLRSAQFLPTVMIVEILRKRLRDENITVVTAGRSADVQRLLPRAQIIQMQETDLSPFFLPRRSLMQKITRRTYDIVIDLNLDLVLPSAYICRESGAPIRVGLQRRHADPFYNFHIHLDPALSQDLLYDRLARCLEMF